MGAITLRHAQPAARLMTSVLPPPPDTESSCARSIAWNSLLFILVLPLVGCECSVRAADSVVRIHRLRVLRDLLHENLRRRSVATRRQRRDSPATATKTRRNSEGRARWLALHRCECLRSNYSAPKPANDRTPSHVERATP